MIDACESDCETGSPPKACMLGAKSEAKQTLLKHLPGGVSSYWQQQPEFKFRGFLGVPRAVALAAVLVAAYGPVQAGG